MTHGGAADTYRIPPPPLTTPLHISTTISSLSAPPLLPSNKKSRPPSASPLAVSHSTKSTPGDDFFHIFSGGERADSMSNIAQHLGARSVTNVDILIDPLMNLANLLVVDKLCSDIKCAQRPRVAIDIPCKHFSVAHFKKNGKRPLRRLSTGGAISDLTADERAAIQESDSFIDAAIRIAEMALTAGGSFIFENPAWRGGTSESNPLFQQMWADHWSLFNEPRMLAFVSRTGGILSSFPQCALGGKFQKWTTTIASPDLAPFAQIISSLSCCHDSHDQTAIGFNKDGESSSELAAAFSTRMNWLWATALIQPDQLSSVKTKAFDERDCLPPPSAKLHRLHIIESWKEGDAMRRAESNRSKARVGNFCVQRLLPEFDHITRNLPLESMEMQAPTVSPRAHWLDRRYKGVDLSWRPPGAADTLFKEGHTENWAKLATWFKGARAATKSLIKGDTVIPPSDLHISADTYRDETRAAAPWATWGKYAKAPVPLAVLIREGILNRHEADEQGVNRDFFRRMRLVDGDKDIIDEYLDCGLEDECTASDIFLAYHHNTCVEWREEFIAVMEADIEFGYLTEYVGDNIPCFPFRTPPKGMLDQIRKRRCITNHSYASRLAVSNNSTCDLSGQPDMRLSSGLSFGHNVGVMASAGIPIRVWKRDGLRAYRQGLTSVLDWLRCGVIWLWFMIDERLNFGGTASPGKFSRWYNVAIREAMRRIRKFDSEYPPTDKLLIAWLLERAGILGIDQCICAAMTQYIDDSLAASFDDHIPALDTTRGKQHIAIFDATMVEAGILMAEGEKAEDSLVCIEGLGIYINIPSRSASLTSAKKTRIKDTAVKLLNGCGVSGCGQTERDEVESLVGKEKWLAHVAPQINSHLTSAYKLAHAPGKSKRVTANPRFVQDQQTIIHMIPALPDIPLVPRSTFPPFWNERHAFAFQDASEKFGIGGWFISDTHLFYYIEPWPTHLGEALRARPRRWYITHGELLAEVITVHAVIEKLDDIDFLTDFTDNDAAKGAANRGSSSSEGMDVAAHWLDVQCQEAGISMRSERVTTKENSVSDLLSRGEEQPAIDAAHLLGLIPFRLRYPPDHPLWEMAVLEVDSLVSSQ